MTESDRQTFAIIMAGLQATFRPDKPITSEVTELYWRVFKAWPIEKFKSACDGVIRTKTISTFPLPAEIIVASDESERGLTAWMYAQRMVGKHGAYMTVEFEDTATHRVIEAMGGWPRFCDCPERERPFKQREFERLYDIFKDRTGEIRQLPGLNDVIPENIVRIPALKTIKEIGQ